MQLSADTSTNAQLRNCLQARSRHRWAPWLLLAVGCSSRTSLSVGTDAPASVGGAMSESGSDGQGVGGTAAGLGGELRAEGGSVGGAAPGTGGNPGTGGLPGFGGAGFTGGVPGTGGLVLLGGAPRTGGVPGTGGVASTGGRLGTGGIVSTGGSSTGEACPNGSVCGGDVVGTWNVTSSCLVLLGDLDMTFVGLGCQSVPATGALQVTGTWTAKANGTYEDNTTTTGSVAFPLSPACMTISSVKVECSKFSSLFVAVGWATSSCSINTTGTCYCSATAAQKGGIGVVSPLASPSGTYRISAKGLSTDDSVDYGYCVSENTLTMTPRPTILPVTGTIVLQKVPSSGTGGATATGGARAQ